MAKGRNKPGPWDDLGRAATRGAKTLKSAAKSTKFYGEELAKGTVKAGARVGSVYGVPLAKGAAKLGLRSTPGTAAVRALRKQSKGNRKPYIDQLRKGKPIKMTKPKKATVRRGTR